MPRKAKKEDNVVEPIVPQKKRGRKPKGGKIITVIENKLANESYSNNVIVHLKCKKSDIISENDIQTNVITSYLDEEENYQLVADKKPALCKKTLNEKLKELQIRLHNNVVNETDSSCFWCTYSFSNLPIAIPKFEINKTYHVYGCFCSPECACAYLMNENIDQSTKFERYHLLNYIYSKVYDYKTNIKPAPDPHYTLKKYFGNLTIEEYREMFDSSRHLFIIDKPITRDLPELHEDYKAENNFNYSNKNKLIMQTFNS